MWHLKYDSFVRRHCKERQLIYPTFGSEMYKMFKGKTINVNMMQPILNKMRGVSSASRLGYADDIEKEHGHYGKLQNRIIDAVRHSRHYTWDDFDFDPIDASALFETDQNDPMRLLEIWHTPEGRTFQFLPDSDDEITVTPPVAHRTRARTRTGMFGEGNALPTDMFGSPFSY